MQDEATCGRGAGRGRKRGSGRGCQEAPCPPTERLRGPEVVAFQRQGVPRPWGLAREGRLSPETTAFLPGNAQPSWSAVARREFPEPGEEGESRVLPPPCPESEVAGGPASGGSPALAALAPWRMGIGAQDVRPEGSWKAERRELPPPRRTVSVPAVKKESETGAGRGSSEQLGGQEKRSLHGQETPRPALLGPFTSQVDGDPVSARSNHIPRDPPVLPRSTSG